MGSSFAIRERIPTMSRLFRSLVALSAHTAETYRTVWAHDEARLTASGRSLIESVRNGEDRKRA